MNKFFVLLNVSLRSMLLSSTNSRGRSKRKAATGLGAVFLIAFLGLYLSGLYSYMLMKALAPSIWKCWYLYSWAWWHWWAGFCLPPLR